MRTRNKNEITKNISICLYYKYLQVKIIIIHNIRVS